MIQTNLFDKSRRTEAIATASGSDDYSACFRPWLTDNWPIYLKFERLAFVAIRRGYEHYSSKTIVELLRWASDMKEKNSEFKINNNRTPDLARLFEAMNQEHAGFFRSRIRKAA
jgi:hypothetical protein